MRCWLYSRRGLLHGDFMTTRIGVLEGQAAQLTLNSDIFKVMDELRVARYTFSALGLPIRTHVTLADLARLCAAEHVAFMIAIQCKICWNRSLLPLTVRIASAAGGSRRLGPAVSDRPAQLPNKGVTAASALLFSFHRSCEKPALRKEDL